MINLIMEQWLLGGKIRSKVVDNIESEEHSEPVKHQTCRKYCRLRVMNAIFGGAAEDFQNLIGASAALVVLGTGGIGTGSVFSL